MACVDPAVCQEACDNSIGCSNIAYPKLVLELLPKGKDYCKAASYYPCYKRAPREETCIRDFLPAVARISLLIYRDYNVVRKASEYEQEIRQLHTADQPTASLGRATEH